MFLWRALFMAGAVRGASRFHFTSEMNGGRSYRNSHRHHSAASDPSERDPHPRAPGETAATEIKKGPAL